MEQTNFTEDLLKLLPCWHYNINKPFKAFMKDKMSLETYYCLQVMRQKGPMTMTELTHRLNVSKQQATKLIDILCEHHFVKRCSLEYDRRCITIEVTKEAEKYMEENIYQDTAFVEQLEQKLGAEDTRRLGQAVGTLLEILSRLD